MPQDETLPESGASAGGSEPYGGDGNREKAAVLTRQALAVLDESDADQAIHLCKKAIKLDPDNPAVYSAQARAYQILGMREERPAGFYTLAMASFRRAAELEPGQEAVHDARIQLALKAGTLDELTREYRARADAQPDNQVFKKVISQISVVSMMTIPDVSGRRDQGVTGFARVLFDYLLPLGSCACTVAGCIIFHYSTGRLQVFGRPMFVIGSVLFALFVVIKTALAVTMRRSRSTKSL